jgi:hypothetical protein
MAVFAMLSAGGAPGVTTAALALTLCWPSQVVIAECDPSGGDILAGLLGGHLPATAGLLPLALEAGAGTEVPADILWRQLVELDEEHNRLLLAGISDPRQSAALQSSLPWIADALQGLRADVLADCGRLDALAAVRPVLSAASLAVLVLRPTLRQVSRAIPRVEMLTNLMGPGRVVLVTVGEGAASGRELAKTLGVPVAGNLPADPKAAAVLSDGLGSRRRLTERPLILAAAAVGRGLRAAAESAGALPGFGGQPVYTPYADGPPDVVRAAPGPPRLDGYPAAPTSPGRHAPADYAPGDYAPAEGTPGDYAPAEYAPGDYAPAEYAAAEYAPPAAYEYEPEPSPAAYEYEHAPEPEAEPDRYPPPPPRLDPYEAGRSGWDPADAGWPALPPDQYRAFGAGQHRAGPAAPGEPDGTHYGPAQNGSRP